MLLRALVVCLLLFSSEVLAQETGSTDTQSTKTEEPPAEDQRKQQKVETSSASMTTTGDSSTGSIGGIKSPESAKVSSGGAATQSIPIAVPPGTAGIQPNLAFGYSTQGENSLLGVGWSISGLPVIHRCARTVAQDGFRGNVNYDADDRFCLDGHRLIATSGTYGANLTEYRTEIDSFLRIVSHGTAGNGPAYFVVKTKDGKTMEFGGNASSQEGRIEAEGKSSVRLWALSKIIDTKGNYLSVAYAEDSANGEYRPTQIDYTGNAGGGLTPNRKVTFEYTTRTDQIPQWTGGSKVLTTKLLSFVKTYVGATLVRDYRLEYEVGTATARSRLKTIKECDAAGNCLPANSPTSQPAWQFTWQEGGTGHSVATWNSSLFTSNALYNYVGDFNGDGRADIASRLGSTAVKMHLSTPTGYDVQTWTVNLYTSDPLFNFVGDFNGDGKADILSRSSTGQVRVNLSTGTGFDIQLWTADLYTSNARWNFVGDFDGDGRSDILSRGGSGQAKVNLSTGGGFATQTWSIDFFTDNPGYNFIGDFNGDGKTDLLSRAGDDAKLNLSTGSNFDIQTWSADLYTGDPFWNFVGDFNGDGKADLLSRAGDNAKVNLSTGTGFEIQTWTIDFNLNNSSWNFLGDFNGDGKIDLMTKIDDTTVAVNLSTGASFTIANWTTDLYTAPEWHFLGDFDGDGKTDISRRRTANNDTTSRLLLVNSPYPDLLTSLTNPFGGTNAITYKSLTDSTVYAKDSGGSAASYPNVDLQYPLYVVASLVTSDGVGNDYSTSYTYGGAKANYLGRGGLGFRWTTEVDDTADVKKTTFYKQEFPLIGLADTVEVDRNSDGAAFVDTVNTYLTGSDTSMPSVVFVGPSQQDTIQYDGGSTSRTIRRTFEYDSFANGNQTRVVHHGDISVSGDERDERTEWAIDAGNWLHRPKRQALYNGSAALVREKWFYYDNQAYGALGGAGLLTKEEANSGGGIGHANNPTITYGYDSAFGVRTATTDARGCTTSTTYESTKTYPQTVTNCLNHQATSAYDARFGVMTSQVNANNQTTTYEHDSFGRPKKVIGPLDSTTHPTITYDYPDWGNPQLQRIVTNRREQHGTSNVIWSEQYFDGLGRGDKTSQEGPGGQEIIIEKALDSRGLVVAATAPYFSSETPVSATYEYDVLGRRTKITNGDATFETNAYAPGVVTLTDERGKIKKQYFNAYNQLIRVDEINGGSTYVTTYEYDAAGSLITVINHLGHTTRMAYDMLGRKIAMCDPNMGTAWGVTSCTTGSVGAWVYTYSKAGDLLTQKDAKNQTLTFTYDFLGRPLTKKQGTTTRVTWTHDDPVVLYSKGKVTQIADQATTTKFAYDQLGRTTQTQRLLLGVWHTMAQQYDALNRITSETFPDSETVTYTYNEAGWLSTVPGYINGITYNARGQKTALTYANNLSTTWTFHASNFRVTNRTTSNNQQNLTYGYDNNGNITSITDSLFTGSRTFGYDDLNRLTSASGTFGTNQSQTSCSYAYNAIGDITDKCGTAFTYGDSMHPSAVTYNPATGKSYTYDANGNMLTRGNQTLTWDIDNRVSSVSISGGGTTTMGYDYTGMRVRKNAPAGTSLYPFQGYEIEPSGTIVKFIRIGIESFASKRGTNKYFYHNDHLGGVNVITDITGTRVQLNEYDPWGGVSRTVGSIDPTHRFTGKELDPETGLYYYGGRYYDPEISRFISADPIVPQPGNPQALNRYSYTINNPQNFIDPSGHSFFGFLKKIFKVLTKYVLPAINPAFALQRAISLLPRPVAAGIGMALGVVTAVTAGDPSLIASGVLGFASAAASLGKSNGWQYASIGLGVAAAAASVYSVYSKHGFGGGGFGVESGTTETPDDPLFFDGDTLTATDGTYSKILWQAKAESGLGGCLNNPACQDNLNQGPIPEGLYSVDPEKIQRYDWWAKFRTFVGRGWRGGEASWGDTRVPIDIPSTTSIGNRTGGFFIHGGTTPGSGGCIDLGKFSTSFFDYFSRQPGPIPLRVQYPRGW